MKTSKNSPASTSTYQRYSLLGWAAKPGLKNFLGLKKGSKGRLGKMGIPGVGLNLTPELTGLIKVLGEQSGSLSSTLTRWKEASRGSLKAQI